MIFRPSFLCLGLALISFNPLQALPVLLTVDVSHPNAVTITATSAAPSTADGAHDLYDGVELENFFSVGGNLGTFYNLSSSTLIPSLNSSPFYDVFDTDDTTVPTQYTALSLFNNGNTTLQTFDPGTTAFTGQAIVDFTIDGAGNLASDLPGLGAIGIIYSGYSGSATAPVAIGEWQVTAVPEPSNWAPVITLLSLMTLGLRRLRQSVL